MAAFKTCDSRTLITLHALPLSTPHSPSPISTLKLQALPLSTPHSPSPISTLTLHLSDLNPHPSLLTFTFFASIKIADKIDRDYFEEANSYSFTGPYNIGGAN